MEVIKFNNEIMEGAKLSILKIHTLGSQVLQSKAEPVENFNGELLEFARSMAETMNSLKGVGLAAPQVGRLLRLIVVNFPIERSEIPGMAEDYSCIINPCLNLAGEKELLDEGCLSLPGIEGSVERYRLCELHARNLKGEDIETIFSGLSARILQHEVDHLEGILFIDRLGKTSRKLLSRKLKQLSSNWKEES
jgi:peptide deformylase